LADTWAGRVVDGRYAVESVLGTGGMGVVVQAHHQFTGARVALKMLHKELQLDVALEGRFLAEARAPNQIGHPAIVAVLDAGRTPEGELYLVMELLVGQSLRDAMQRRMPPVEVRRIARELLDALAAAHARGFVHRDLKPENVFIAAPNAAVKLLDFGVAKGINSATLGVPRTAAGVLLGTLAYMAPEQLKDASTVDPRADLWAIGAMMYELMSGHLPFEADSIVAMFGLLASAEPDPIQRWIPTVSPAISVFFSRALARDPNARFGSAMEMSAAIAQLPFEDHVITRDSRPIAPVGTATAAASWVAPALQTGPAPLVTPVTQFDTELVPASHRGRMIAMVIAALAIATGVIGFAVTRAKPAARVVATTNPATDAVLARPDAAIAALDCEASCAWLASCGLRTNKCVADCQSTHGFGECIQKSHDQCDAFSACSVGSRCAGEQGTGHASCKKALACQFACKPNDMECACGCTKAAAAPSLTLVLAYSVCAANCGADADCRAKVCTAAYAQCQSH